MLSLLWKNFEGLLSDNNNQDLESIINDKVFDDLKLRRVLETIYDTYSESDEVIEVMSKIPNLDSIEMRREILDDFFSSNNELEKLYYKLQDLVSRYEAILSATERIKKRYLLLFYYYNLFIFLDYVSDFIEINKYKSDRLIAIKNEIDEYIGNNRAFIEETNSLYDDLMNVLKLTVEYHDNAPYITIENEKVNNLEDNLLEIANLLGIKIEKPTRTLSRKEINAYYLLEIVNSNEKLRDRLFNYYDKNNDEIICLSKYVRELKYYVMIKLLFEKVCSYGVPKAKCHFNNDKTTFKDIYDISLVTSKIETIPNDFIISDDENVQFILGVNSGGKTCYIRSVGINYILALTTGYVFGKEANVMIMKYINTHFPNEENYKVGDGRLVDEVNRLNTIEKTFCRNSISFLNETFSSTSESKACDLTFELLDKCKNSNAKVLFVTHQYKIFDELHDSKIGFYTPQVSEENGNKRTYKIKKVEKKLLSYVSDILIKHGLTKEELMKRKKI